MPAAWSSTAGKDYKETRLQVHSSYLSPGWANAIDDLQRRFVLLLVGSLIRQHYPAIRVGFYSMSISLVYSYSSLALREVAEFLAGQTLSVDVDTVSFAQHFPR